MAKQNKREKKGRQSNCGKEISDLRNTTWSRIWNLLKVVTRRKGGFPKRFPKLIRFAQSFLDRIWKFLKVVTRRKGFPNGFQN